MRKMGLIVLGIGVVFSANARAEDSASPAVHPDTSGWEDVFAPDLSNAIAPEGVWAWKDGVLSANKDECIWSKKVYGNFILDLEFQTSPHSNSGVLFHCFDLSNWIPNSLEIQIADSFGQAPHIQNCGAIYAHVAPTKQMVKAPGQWNRLTLTCDGPMVFVAMNGERIAEMDMRRWTSAEENPDGTKTPKALSRPLSEFPAQGHIGLQGLHANSPTFYRNIKIKENE